TARPDAPLADILAAFLRPFLEVLAGTDEGWILYLRLIGRGMSNYARGGVHPALRQLAGIPDLLKEALRARYPLADEAAFHLASYMLEVALTHIVQDRGLLAARSEGQVEIARAIAHLDEISRYFAAGFAAIALRAES
ncbi:MAG TPA: hypothetical protein VFF98_11005, partial [Novosphingobium sp.]|nr:hypothetical protein [Novosphingobium sp.]